jgi:hypothetical protein
MSRDPSEQLRLGGKNGRNETSTVSKNVSNGVLIVLVWVVVVLACVANENG